METENIRRYDLDWVRVLTILLVFLYHSSLFFWTGWWYIKNAQTSALTNIFVHIMDFWMMPLLFMVAGSAAWFSMRYRKGGEFIKERVLRLLIPFAFGLLVLIPPVTYLDRTARGLFSGSFIQYYPHFFQGFYSFFGPWKGDFNLAHLWFLIYLFVVTIIALPVISRLGKAGSKNVMDWLARFTAKPGAIYLYALPGIIIAYALSPIFPHSFILFNDWSYILCVLTLFIFGFIFCVNNKFWPIVEKTKNWSMGFALVTTLIWIVIWAKGINSPSTYSLSQIPFTVLWICTTWFWLLAVLGYAHRYLNFSNRFLAYASEASLPFYIIHVTVLIVVGFFVVQWNVSAWAKYLLMVSISFTSIVLIYEFIIKRVGLIRFLFGMRAKAKIAKSTMEKSTEPLSFTSGNEGLR
jgi:glucan biosynthesis protein C